MLEMKIAMAVLLGQFDIAHVGTADGSPPQERLPFAMMPVGWLMRLKGREVGEGRFGCIFEGLRLPVVTQRPGTPTQFKKPSKSPQA